MKILVTGEAGYIGSILVPILLNCGYDVMVIDDFRYNQTSLTDHCNNEKSTIIRGDARSRTLISKCIQKVDTIIPLACLTGAPICSKDPIGAQTINFDAIKMILDIRDKRQTIIFPATNSGYGIGKKDAYCTEDTPLNPISLYSRLKVDIEKLLLDGGNCITLRFATVMGMSPRMRLDLLVNDFTYRAVNDRFLVIFEPHFRRNYIHVRDAANAFIHCIDNFDQMKNEPYNVGLSNANISKWELCEEIKKQVSDFYFVEAAIGEDPDKRDYVTSNVKIEATGFKAKYSLQETIAELIKGYQIIKRNQFSNV